MSKRAAALHNLPSEITEAILLLLPPKSVTRFKSVSKTWHSLISDPQFIKTHLHQHQTTKFILVSDTDSLYSIGINELFPYLNNDDIPAAAKEVTFGSPPIQWTETLGSSNGLVLAKSRGKDNTIYLINPTTKDLWEVPLSPVHIKKSILVYGFGYDSSTDDYKVITISLTVPYFDTDPDFSNSYVGVYSLRNNSWRKLNNSPYGHDARHLSNSGVLVNQNLHWVASPLGYPSTRILGFSLANEDFNEVKLPDSIENEKAVDGYNLVVVGGKLGVLSGSWESKNLWVMDKYGASESWTRICIELGPVWNVCLVEGSNRDIVMDDLEEGEVVVYNIDEKRRTNVRIVGGPGSFRSNAGGMYVESLESPKRFVTTP